VTEGSSAGLDAVPGEREALQLVHHHPGRVRVRALAFQVRDRAPAGKDDAGAGSAGAGALAESVVARVRTAVEAIPGITRFAHNGRTGSLLVEYQPGLTEPDFLLAHIADAAGIARYRADATHRPSSPGLLAVDAARELNAIAYELTGWRADLRSVIPAGLAAFAAYSFAVGKEDRLPRWDNLLYWSYNVFVSLHRREIDETREVGGGVAARETMGQQAIPTVKSET
jgi:hypothetical protein